MVRPSRFTRTTFLSISTPRSLSIFVSAPIVAGNSGGPLIDAKGYVIGVASASYGASTVGGCIPIRHAISLLPAHVVQQLSLGRET